MVDAQTPGSPPSSRIISELARRISTGELGEGDRVPSTRQITREFGVAMATATRVLTVLRQQGLVHMVPGVGTIVGSGPAAVAYAGATTTTSSSGDLSGPQQGVTSRATMPITDPDNRSGQPLTRERIILAGVSIADTEGILALSLRRVATAVGTATMSLYRHVINKDQLLALMANRVFMEYPLPPADPDWRASLEKLCRLQWQAYHDHPWVAQYVSMTRPQLIPSAIAHTEMAMSVLGQQGLDVGERLHAAVMLANYVRGTAVSLEPEALAEQDTGMTNDEWMDTQNELMAKIVASGRFPAFAEMSAASDVQLDLDTLFEFGLNRLLDGLEMLVQQRSGRPVNGRSSAAARRGVAARPAVRTRSRT